MLYATVSDRSLCRQMSCGCDCRRPQVPLRKRLGAAKSGGGEGGWEGGGGWGAHNCAAVLD